jgi:arylsulfatase
MPTPNLDRLAAEGIQFLSFYAQPSCTPGRAAMQTGRIPNRSGMTTVAFQGQGGGLPAAEWTLASVLKTGGYKTFFTGKWHLGEADYALPIAQGYDEMKYVGLYHLNAYTYGDQTWFPDMPEDLRALFQRVTIGGLSGNAGETAKEEFKINGQYVDTPVINGQPGVVGIPSSTVTSRNLARRSRSQRAFDAALMSINSAKVHCRICRRLSSNISRFRRANMPTGRRERTRISRILDKIRALGLDNTHVFWTSDNGARQDVPPTPATRRSAAPRNAARGRQPRSSLHGVPGSRLVKNLT